MSRPPAFGAFHEHPLTGYLDRDELAPGEQLVVRASGPVGPARLRVLRAGAPEASSRPGPGFGEQALAWGPPDAVALEPRGLRSGSYLEVTPAPTCAGAFTFAVWCRPTLLRGGWHAIAAAGEAGAPSWGLFVSAAGVVSAMIHDGIRARWCSGRQPLALDDWRLLALVHDPDAGTLSLLQAGRDRDEPVQVDRVGNAGRPCGSAGHLLLGAQLDATGSAAGHFNGRLARPLALDRAVAPDELRAVVAARSDPRLLAAWALEDDVSAVRVRDLGPGGFDARAHNAPLRAVAGPTWAGRDSRRYEDRPGDYDAIHLHDDDLDDADWPVTATIEVPDDARPGIHLARITTADDALCLPFVVVGGTADRRLAYLAPTLSWQAYASDRPAHEQADDGAVDSVGALYDLHDDGTPRHLCSRLRPTRSGAPEHGSRPWGAHTLAADLMLVGGLEALDLPHAMLADRALHDRGSSLLARYRCVVVGPHPEYTTAPMRDALDAYLAGGGRIVYLGGNGFYWVTSLDPARPHLIEVRKGGQGEVDASFKVRAGESQHQTTLEDGGTWCESERPPRALVGVEFSANGHADGDGRRGFVRRPAAADPRHAWVFEGVGPDDPLGAYGANLGSAVGYEMDAVTAWTWSPEQPAPVLLARCADDGLYGQRLVPRAPVSDIALRVLPNGGATFAAGSVTWSGSLQHDGFDNDIARITANVVRRFVDTPAGEPVSA